MIDRDEMSRFRTNWRSSHNWILAGLIVTYLLSRLLWLKRFPPFIDEMVHIWMAIMVRMGHFGAGFSEGRWLASTLIAPILALPGDALWEARLVFVICGLFSTIGIFLIGAALFSTRAGLIAALLYVIIPYALFYNRLALTDGMVVAFGVWIVFVTILTLGSEKEVFSVVLATLLILSFLVKGSAMIFILIPLLAVLILIPTNQWSKAFKRVLPAIVGGGAILLVLLSIDYGGYNIRIVYGHGAERTLSELLLINGGQLLEWAWRLLSPVLAITLLLAVSWSLFVKRSRSKFFLLSLLILSVGPTLPISLASYPRYTLFALVPVTLLLGSFLSWVIDRLFTLVNGYERLKFLPLALMVLLLAWPLYLDYQILVSPETASLPGKIRWQYFEGWPSGYGLRELAEYLKTEAKDVDDGQLLVVRPLLGGQVYAAGLELYLYDAERFELPENVALRAIGVDLESDLTHLSEWIGQGHRVLIVGDTANPAGMAIIERVSPYVQLERIWYYPRPANDKGFTVWEAHQASESPLAGHQIHGVTMG